MSLFCSRSGRPPPSRRCTNAVSSSTATHFLLFRLRLIGVVAVLLTCWPASLGHAQKLSFPQIIKVRYEAVGLRVGGQFIIWVEREKVWYGLDAKIFPAAKAVDVTHITPAPGTTTITLITVIGINSAVPDYFHLSGNARFKISGMKIVSSNLP